MARLNVIVASTRPGRVGRQIGDWFAAAVMLDELWRLTAAFTTARSAA